MDERGSIDAAELADTADPTYLTERILLQGGTPPEEASNCNQQVETAAGSADGNKTGVDQLRRRELNRISKARCRKRRTDLLRKLEADIARLSAEQFSLEDKNKKLRQEFLRCVASLQQQEMSNNTNSTTFALTPGFPSNQGSISTNGLLPLLHGVVNSIPPKASTTLASHAINFDACGASQGIVTDPQQALTFQPSFFG